MSTSLAGVMLTCGVGPEGSRVAPWTIPGRVPNYAPEASGKVLRRFPSAPKSAPNVMEHGTLGPSKST
eukprot:5574542-Pyramimonas_sp.AAC.1